VPTLVVEHPSRSTVLAFVRAAVIVGAARLLSVGAGATPVVVGTLAAITFVGLLAFVASSSGSGHVR